MTERADGFWWVRHGMAWIVVELDHGDDGQFLVYPGMDRKASVGDHNIVEWGPYLGTEPGGVPEGEVLP